MEKDMVRIGYDAMGEEYTAARTQSERELGLLNDLAGRLPDGARVLDAGCGAGVPVAQWLSRRFRPGAVEEFFGAPMYWSHHDAATNLDMIQEAGFELLRWELVAEALDGESGAKHLFVLARRL